MKKQFIIIFTFSILFLGTTFFNVNAIENTLNATINLQDIGSLSSVPEVPTINVQKNTTYTLTLSIVNNILLGGDTSRKISIVSVKPRLPNSFVLKDPVVCPYNFEEVRLSNNSRDVGIINCVEIGLNSTGSITTSNPQYDITYGQTGNVSFTFTTPTTSGSTDLSLGIGSINSDGVIGTGYWSLHIVVANPVCTIADWSCTDWGECRADGNYFQNRTCSKTTNCEGGIASPSTQQICTPPFCTSWTYTDWGVCDPILGYQSRNEISAFPSGCIIDYVNGPGPINRQRCSVVPSCTLNDWSCTDWGTCSQNNTQTRTCNKISNCQSDTSSPVTSQSCTLPLQPIQPSCTADTWFCGDWNSCSISGVQNRSCKITFDCPSVVTAPPVTDQYCEAPNKPTQQTPPDSSEIANQDTIIKATVKLICPFDEKWNKWMEGSGTIIDQSGMILTNKHVVSETLGCLVGFINNFNDEPYFGNRQIADIVKESSSEDVAVLKLRNPQNNKLSFIDITKGNSNNLRLGTNVNIYGYPSKFGTNMTYTSGSFSGTSGSYLKTSAIIEHGNSGGGAYLNDGTFIGIPSGVLKGELNALGYILSISTINSWLGNSPSVVYNNNSNNYSRVSSILESIDLKTLDSLQLVIPGTKEYKEIIDNSNGVVNPVFNRNLKKGMSGDDVKQLQTLLKKLNYFPIDQDTTNYFGAITHAAVIKFQKDNNIKPVAGLFGPLTRAKILSLNK